jgi:hypothetical protein
MIEHEVLYWIGFSLLLGLWIHWKSSCAALEDALSTGLALSGPVYLMLYALTDLACKLHHWLMGPF